MSEFLENTHVILVFSADFTNLRSLFKKPDISIFHTNWVWIISLFCMVELLEGNVTYSILFSYHNNN